MGVCLFVYLFVCLKVLANITRHAPWLCAYALFCIIPSFTCPGTSFYTLRGLANVRCFSTLNASFSYNPLWGVTVLAFRQPDFGFTWSNVRGQLFLMCVCQLIFIAP